MTVRDIVLTRRANRSRPPIRYLSLFSGIEAATVAWSPLGWQPVAFAEIDPFCSTLLAHYYPHVPNLGDVTVVSESQIRALGTVDVVVFGSPCQDLSVAGLRAGLGGNRSNLFFAGMDVARWSGARFTLWENVPGAFSSNHGKDFAAVVGDMCGARFDPPSKGWQNTGVAIGPRGLVEWCVLDSQWFGVPQRRRRVFALLDTGDWAGRSPLLFEPESLRRDTPPSREAGQRVASRPEDGVGTSGGAVAKVTETLRSHPRPGSNSLGNMATVTTHQNTGQGWWNESPVATAVCTPAGGGSLKTNVIAYPIIADACRESSDALTPSPDAEGRIRLRDPGLGIGDEGDPCYTLQASAPHVVAYGGNRTAGPLDVATACRAKGGAGHGDFESETFLVQQAISFKPSHYTCGKDGAPDEVVSPLSADADKGDQDTLLLVPAVAPIAFSSKDAALDSGPLSPTLRAMGHAGSHANAGGQVAIAFQERGRTDGPNLEYQHDIAYALTSPCGGGRRQEMNVAIPDVSLPLRLASDRPASHNKQNGTDCEALITVTPHPTVRDIVWARRRAAKDSGGGRMEAMCFEPRFARNDRGAPESIVSPLKAQSDKGDSAPCVAGAGMAIRRLTPRECERLQSFPDDYTLIPYRNHPAADGPRYKAIGNSMTMSVILYLGKRIADVMKR